MDSAAPESTKESEAVEHTEMAQAARLAETNIAKYRRRTDRLVMFQGLLSLIAAVFVLQSGTANANASSIAIIYSAIVLILIFVHQIWSGCRRSISQQQYSVKFLENADITKIFDYYYGAVIDPRVLAKIHERIANVASNIQGLAKCDPVVRRRLIVWRDLIRAALFEQQAVRILIERQADKYENNFTGQNAIRTWMATLLFLGIVFSTIGLFFSFSGSGFQGLIEILRGAKDEINIERSQTALATTIAGFSFAFGASGLTYAIYVIARFQVDGVMQASRELESLLADLNRRVYQSVAPFAGIQVVDLPSATRALLEEQARNSAEILSRQAQVIENLGQVMPSVAESARQLENYLREGRASWEAALQSWQAEVQSFSETARSLETAAQTIRATWEHAMSSMLEHGHAQTEKFSEVLDRFSNGVVGHIEHLEKTHKTVLDTVERIEAGRTDLTAVLAQGQSELVRVLDTFGESTRVLDRLREEVVQRLTSISQTQSSARDETVQALAHLQQGLLNGETSARGLLDRLVRQRSASPVTGL